MLGPARVHVIADVQAVVCGAADILGGEGKFSCRSISPSARRCIPIGWSQ